MKTGLLTSFALTGALALACSPSVTTTRIELGEETDGGTPDGGGSKLDGAGPDAGDPADPPHALGTIILGEAHTSADGSPSTPLVSARFVPDSKLALRCATRLDASCELQTAPKCTKNTTSSSGCDTNEACELDTSCSPICKPLAVCKTACGADEVCQPDGTGTGAGACVKTETFDAGPLAFSGTTTPITLFPPYAFHSAGSGAPFLGGAAIHVQAQGAAGAGFEKFDEMFTATTFIQTSPALSSLTRAVVFGQGAVPIGWAPGSDSIVVVVSGAGGSATCTVQDSLGRFDLPRAAIAAALGDGTTSSASLAISVGRQKKDVRKNEATKGSLASATVQPVGWLELVTSSTESAIFQGCSAQTTICGDSCVDLQTDSNNCKTCGNVCSGGSVCSAGVCGGSLAACTACVGKANVGTCAAVEAACNNDAACVALKTCLPKCAPADAACVALCRSQNAAATTKLDAADNCVATACSGACQSL